MASGLTLDVRPELEIAQYRRPCTDSIVDHVLTVSTLPLSCLVRSSHKPVVLEDGRDGLDSTPRRKSLASHGSRLHFLSDTITVTLHRQSPCNWPGPGRPEEAAGHPRPSDPHSVMEEGSEPESSSNTRNKYILNY
ncbi:hypothetical protein J6590_098403 [Homalodisca vitripennis]|nr:hypothetical protein J6590_098403 [Homalodisca vitripennis]